MWWLGRDSTFRVCTGTCWLSQTCVHNKMLHSISGPSCSKLTTSLVNDSLKFTSSDTQIC